MGDRVIVDASVGIAYVRDEVTTAAVDRAATTWSRRGAQLVVPAVFWTEIVNVLGTRHRYRAAQTAEALRELDEVGLETVEIGRPEMLLVADAVDRTTRGWAPTSGSCVAAPSPARRSPRPGPPAPAGPWPARARPPYPFRTPSGVSRRTGRTRSAEAAITTSMSL